jgi:5-methylcytosine-specific restriction protein A
MSADLAEFRRSGLLRKSWSCGRTRRIERGDRVYLMRLGLDPKGIIGSGFVTQEPHEEEHWDQDRAAAGDGALFVEVGFDQLSEVPLIGLAELEEPPFAEVNWTPQGSGFRILPAVSAALDAAWARRTGAGFLQGPDELVSDLPLVEGAQQTVTVNAYERNPEARRRCLAHYGHRCFVCDFSFEEVYGDYVRRYIHVHHIVPVSAIGESYVVDPIRDLRPLCPNCHAAIHRTNPIISPEDLRDLIRARPQREHRRV